MRSVLIVLISVLLSVAASAAWMNTHQRTATMDGQPMFDRVFKTKTLLCGYVVYPPYMFKDAKTGKLGGIGYDVTEEAAKILSLKVEWVEELPIGSELAGLEKNDVDSVCAIVGPYDPALFPLISYSDSYLRVENGMFTRADNPAFKAGPYRLKDFDDPSIHFTGIESDTSYIFPKTLTPKAQMAALPQFSDPSLLFMDMAGHKADYAMLEPATAEIGMRANPGKFRCIPMAEILPSYEGAMAFRKNEAKLTQTLSTAIRHLKINGQIDAILDKYDPKRDMILRVAP